MRPNPSRRRLLAAVAGTGALLGTGAVAREAAGLAPVATTRRRQVSNAGGPDVLVEWVVLSNGEPLDGPGFEGEGGDAPAGPSVQMGNLLPGDSGALVVRLSVASGEGPPAHVRASLSLTENAENGVNEPEADAGDDSTGPGAGELADELSAAMWYDEGALGVDGVGERNGVREPGESLVAPGSTGSLQDVVDALAGGVTVAPDDDGRPCLRPGESVSVALGWELPTETPQTVQGDSVRFDLAFQAERCEGGGD